MTDVNIDEAKTVAYECYIEIEQALLRNHWELETNPFVGQGLEAMLVFLLRDDKDPFYEKVLALKGASKFLAGSIYHHREHLSANRDVSEKHIETVLRPLMSGNGFEKECQKRMNKIHEAEQTVNGLFVEAQATSHRAKIKP